MQISKEEKESIKILEFEKSLCDEDIEQAESTVRVSKAISIVLNLIEKQSKKIEHLKNLNEQQSKDITKAVNYTFELNKEIEINDKMIDEMAEYIDFDKMNFGCSPLCFRPNCKTKCIKEYLRKKVENG